MDNVVLFNISEQVLFEEKHRLNRASSLALEFASKGSNIFWVSSSFSHLLKRYLSAEEKKNPENISMIFLASLKYTKNLSLVRFLNNIFLGVQAFILLLKIKDVKSIYCYTPPIEIIYACALYSRFSSVPFYVDVRDNWPDGFVNHLPPALKFFDKFIFFPWRVMLKYSLKKAKRVIASSVLQAEFAKKYFQREDEIKIFPIGDKIQTIDVNAEKGISKILFIGTLTPIRPLHLIFEHLKKLDTDYEFHIVGNGDLMEEYLEISKDMDNVYFHGRQVGKSLNEIVSKSNILIAPYKKEESYGYSLPAKISSYVGYGRPIITNLSQETEELLKVHDLGSVIDFNNFEEFQNALNYWSNINLQEYYLKARNIYQRKFDLDQISSQIRLYMMEEIN